MMANIPTVDVFGIPVAKIDMRETVDVLIRAVEEKRITRVITANPIMIMTALENPAYHEMMRTADLLVPDGAGLVWAASYIGNPVKERVAGFDLMHELLKAGSARGWRAYLVGTTSDVIGEAARVLQERYPGCTFAYRDGFFGADEDEEVIARIREFQPDLLFVGRSVSTQEPWIAKYKEELAVPVMMGIGGSFDTVAGKTKRAPLWMQRIRMEWFFRLIQEPSRFPRMLALPKFAVKVIREKEKMQ